jgi:hypothetical protein
MIKEMIAKAFGMTVGRIDWPSTFKVAAMRSAAGGLAWAFIALFTGNAESFLAFAVFGAPVGLFFMIPLAVFALLGGKVFWPLGLLGFVPLVFMVAGDPILWAIEKARPGTIPMANFQIINGKTILIIIDDGNSLDLSVSKLIKSEEVASFAPVSQLRGMMSGSEPETGQRQQQSSPSRTSAPPERADVARAPFRLSELADEPDAAAPSREAAGTAQTDQATALHAVSPQDSEPVAGAELHAEDDPFVVAQSARFEAAKADFRRLSASRENPQAMRDALMIIAGLCDETCRIPGPYVFLAETFARLDLKGRFDMIMTNLAKGHAACAGNRQHQEEIELAYCVLGRLAWDASEERLAFEAYMSALRRWQDAGHVIAQAAPVQYRIAFVAARMFSKNALDAGEAEMAGEFFDLCEVFGVDMNFEIDVSDGLRKSG